MFAGKLKLGTGTVYCVIPYQCCVECADPSDEYDTEADGDGRGWKMETDHDDVINSLSVNFWHKGLVMCSFDGFLVVILDKPLNKESNEWCNKTTQRSRWRQMTHP